MISPSGVRRWTAVVVVLVLFATACGRSYDSVRLLSSEGAIVARPLGKKECDYYAYVSWGSVFKLLDANYSYLRVSDWGGASVEAEARFGLTARVEHGVIFASGHYPVGIPADASGDVAVIAVPSDPLPVLEAEILVRRNMGFSFERSRMVPLAEADVGAVYDESGTVKWIRGGSGRGLFTVDTNTRPPRSARMLCAFLNCIDVPEGRAPVDHIQPAPGEFGVVLCGKGRAKMLATSSGKNEVVIYYAYQSREGESLAAGDSEWLARVPMQGQFPGREFSPKSAIPPR